MAGFAKCDNIELMRCAIASVVMIFPCVLSAMQTWKRFRWGESACLYSVGNSATSQGRYTSLDTQ